MVFADLVREFSASVGTGALLMTGAVPGFKTFLGAGIITDDSFYYSIINLDKLSEAEVGIGTLESDGTISRAPFGGTPVNFSAGLKTIALTVAADWFDQLDMLMVEGPFVPPGGTAGQLLTKNGPTDFDSAWAGLTAASLPALTGDVTKPAGSGVTTVVNVPVGATPALTGDVTKAAGSGTTVVANVPIGATSAFSGGDVTKSAGSGVLTIGANKVTRGMLAAAAGTAFVGATAAGNLSDLTPTVATSMLDSFGGSIKGLVPASAGGTTNFLRADGSWTAPTITTVTTQAAGTNNTSPASTAFVQTALGTTTVNTTGGSTTLTAAQSATQVIRITGALTSNVNLYFGTGNPNWDKSYTVVNATSGAFTVTLFNSSDIPGTGIVVPQGTSAEVYTIGAGGTLNILGFSDSTSAHEATDSDIWIGTAANRAITPRRAFSAGVEQALTDGATITPDFNTGLNFSVTLGGNRNLASPTNAKSGQSGYIAVKQDATGGRTLTYGTNWKFPGGAAANPLSTAANAIDLLAYAVRPDGTIFTTLAKAFAS